MVALALLLKEHKPLHAGTVKSTFNKIAKTVLKERELSLNKKRHKANRRQMRSQDNKQRQ